MSAPGGPPVAIGVGNLLLGDDAAGVRVVERLRRTAEADPALLPAGTRLVDGGTLGVDLLRHLDGACGLVLVDAGDRGDAPGTVTVRRDATPDGDRALDGLLGIADLLGVLPPAVSVIEIGVGEIAPGIGLSPAVESALPAATAVALHELGAMAAAAAPAEVPA
jgi:hydrogenase maturation protease